MINFGNNFAVGILETGGSGIPTAKSTRLLTGTLKGTIVKSLEIMTGNESCYVEIIRTSGNEPDHTTEEVISQNSYATIRIDMKANDYLVLWEGFFVIPYGKKLYFKSDSTQCKAVVNYVEMT